MKARRKARDPRTPEEWQEAVDGAKFFLAMSDAKLYGLIEGGPGVNAERCLEILERGEKLGHVPAPMEMLCERFIDGKAAAR